MENLENILKEYVATANNSEYGGDYSIINSKFPELADIDPRILEEYVATANNPNYSNNYNIINGKFPELFKKKTTPITPTTGRTTTGQPTEDEIRENVRSQVNFVDKDFWDNAGWTDKKTGNWVNVNRDNYFKKDGKWYYKRSTDGKEFELTKGVRYDALIAEEKRVDNYIENYKKTEKKKKEGKFVPETNWERQMRGAIRVNDSAKIKELEGIQKNAINWKFWQNNPNTGERKEYKKINGEWKKVVTRLGVEAFENPEKDAFVQLQMEENKIEELLLKERRNKVKKEEEKKEVNKEKEIKKEASDEFWEDETLTGEYSKKDFHKRENGEWYFYNKTSGKWQQLTRGYSKSILGSVYDVVSLKFLSPDKEKVEISPSINLSKAQTLKIIEVLEREQEEVVVEREQQKEKELKNSLFSEEEQEHFNLVDESKETQQTIQERLTKKLLGIETNEHKSWTPSALSREFTDKANEKYGLHSVSRNDFFKKDDEWYFVTKDGGTKKLNKSLFSVNKKGIARRYIKKYMKAMPGFNMDMLDKNLKKIIKPGNLESYQVKHYQRIIDGAWKYANAKTKEEEQRKYNSFIEKLDHTEAIKRVKDENIEIPKENDDKYDDSENYNIEIIPEEGINVFNLFTIPGFSIPTDVNLDYEADKREYNKTLESLKEVAKAKKKTSDVEEEKYEAEYDLMLLESREEEFKEDEDLKNYRQEKEKWIKDYKANPDNNKIFNDCILEQQKENPQTSETKTDPAYAFTTGEGKIGRVINAQQHCKQLYNDEMNKAFAVTNLYDSEKDEMLKSYYSTIKQISKTKREIENKQNELDVIKEKEKKENKRIAEKNMPKVSKDLMLIEGDFSIRKLLKVGERGSTSEELIEKWWNEYLDYGFTFEQMGVYGIKITSSMDLDGDGVNDSMTVGYASTIAEKKIDKVDEWMRKRATYFENSMEAFADRVVPDNIKTAEALKKTIDNNLLKAVAYNYRKMHGMKDSLKKILTSDKMDEKFRLKKGSYSDWTYIRDVISTIPGGGGRVGDELQNLWRRVLKNPNVINDLDDYELNQLFSIIDRFRDKWDKDESKGTREYEMWELFQSLDENNFKVYRSPTDIAPIDLSVGLGSSAFQIMQGYGAQSNYRQSLLETAVDYVFDPENELNEENKEKIDLKKEYYKLVSDYANSVGKPGNDKAATALMENDIYRIIHNLHSDTHRNMSIEKATSELTENLSGNLFEKGEAQTAISKEMNRELDVLEDEIKKSVRGYEIVRDQLTTTIGSIEDGYGLAYEADWLEKRGKTIHADIEEIKNRKFLTQEDIAKANDEIIDITSEYSSHRKAYNLLLKDKEDLYVSMKALQIDAEELLHKEPHFKIMADVLQRNHEVGAQMLHSLRNAVVEMGQNLINWGQTTWYYVNPLGALADYLMETVDIEKNATQLFLQSLTGVGDASRRFDDDPNTNSYIEDMNEGIDAMQANWDSQIEKPPAYGDINNFSDFGEWFGVMFAGQVPQLLTLMATGGTGGLAILGSSAAGGKFLSMEEQKKLFEETGGVHGMDYSNIQMFLSSGAVGGMEALSERITLGQIKGVRAFLKTNPGKQGFKKYMNEVVFTKEFAKHVGRGGIDLVEEGVSEVVATMSENLIDMINGVEGVGIYDNIEESFVSGALISQTIKSPIVFSHMVRPFLSPSNTDKINSNDSRIQKLMSRLNGLGKKHNLNRRDKENKEEWSKEITELYKENETLIALDVKRVDGMSSSEKRDLLDIHREQEDLKKKAQDINNDETKSEKQRIEEIGKLRQKLSESNARKRKILERHTPDVIDSRWERAMNSVRARAREFAEHAKLQVNIEEGNSDNFFDWMLKNEGYEVIREDVTDELATKPQDPVRKEIYKYKNDEGQTEYAHVTTAKDGSRKMQRYSSATPSSKDKLDPKPIRIKKGVSNEQAIDGNYSVDGKVTLDNEVEGFENIASKKIVARRRKELGPKSKRKGEVAGIRLNETTRQGYIDLNQEILDNKKSSVEDKKEAQRKIDLLNKVAPRPGQKGDQTLGMLSQESFDFINGSKSNYGVHIPVFETGKNGKPVLKGHNIFINKATAIDDGKYHTGAHELLHAILYMTLKRDPALQVSFGRMVIKALEAKEVEISEKLWDTIRNYEKGGKRGEEIMTLISESYNDNEIKLPKSALGIFKNWFRRWSQSYRGRDIAFDKDQDVIDFIKDYAYSIKNNKENKAITKMFSKGAVGSLLREQQEIYRKEKKKNTPTKGEAMFSKNVDQAIMDDSDLLTEFDKLTKEQILDDKGKFVGFAKDKNGKPISIWKNKVKEEMDNGLTKKEADEKILKEWQGSTDFVEAWQLITQSKKLDGLIQAGMVGEGINTPQALGEFTRKVKDEISMRLIKDFDPTVNDSLFGWLTGISGGAGKSIIYRAKGDVMVKYSKDLKTISIDTDITTTEGDTFSSQIEGEPDVEIEKLEEEDITIGKAVVKKSDIDIIFLESVNANRTVIKAVNNVIEGAGVNLKGLTYNGTKKNIVKHDGGKPKSKRKPTGPLYKVLDIISKEFGVDGTRIIKEQDLTNTQRTLAREYITEHAQKLIDMLPEGENRSGDATGVANTVLGEFYVKGERISMAEAGTGKGKISQTKRGDITTDEFIEFFNKPGTKSDGAIRALITQAATISANQAIRLNAMKKESDPISTIALVGDGKNAMMFSVNDSAIDISGLERDTFQGIGKITRNLSEGATIDFYNGIHDFASQKMVDTNLESIEIALRDTYGDIIDSNYYNKEIIDNLGQIAKSIHGVVRTLKPEIINDPVELSVKLVESDLKAEVQVRESSNSPITNREAYRNEERRNRLIGLNKVFAKKVFDPNNLERSIGKILMLKDHLGSASGNPNSSKAWFKVSQIFRGNVDFLPEILNSIPGIKVETKGKKTVLIDYITYTNPNIEGAEPIIVRPESIKSSQKSIDAYNDIIAFENGNPTKLNIRDNNENIAQDLLNEYVEFWSDMFKQKHIDNAELMMVKSGLLSGMTPMLARAGKVEYISDPARALLKKHGKNAEVRYEHAPPRVQMINDMFDKHINGDGIPNTREYFKEYKVQIITKKFDKVLGDAKLGSSLLEGTTVNTPGVGMMRNYNDRTRGKYVESVRNIRTGEAVVLAEAFVLTNEMLNKNRENTMMMSKAVNQANKIDENTPSRGMSAFDFDETVGISDNFVIAKKDGKTKKIASNEWPFVGETMKEEGWEMDFTDFDKVTRGRPGPLMDKLRNRIKKFGPENNYIVTARAAESEVNIHAYLKSENIDIPIENITGLGNSTGEAKARWIVEKFAEGYNDIYFVDDALPNVKAVKDVMDQLDIKGSSVQAKMQFSKRIDPEFNDILNGNVQAELDLNRVLEQTKGVKAEAVFSDVQAKIRGSKKGKWKFWVPYSAEDFKGLIYRFITKGKIGEQQMAFFKKALFDPFNRGYTAMNMVKQKLQNEYRTLLKEFSDVKKILNNQVGNTNFTTQQAIRVYLWNKAGFEIPGLSQRDLDTLVKAVESDVELKAFADTLGVISNQEAGYIQPNEYWTIGSIQSDIDTINNEINRVEHLAEWKQNIEKMFGTWGPNGTLVGPNINKIEAIYGTKFKEALEDIIWRMEFGTRREAGSNKLVNRFNNWANQSVGAIMFLNMRSALLQTISSINYLNWSDNNPLKAGMALANFPQFIKDFAMIFNSDMLKQRRGGQQRGVNEAELAKAVEGVGIQNRVRAMIHWLLTKGFLPTQIADSFAISSGGATFYRNRVNTYLKKGMSQQEAETKAWEDFQENTEESQQSARPDMISQQQASPLGRYILAFKNTPMQYARLTKKAFLDLINGRGDTKTNVGKIMYYMAIQNLIFSGLQAALGAMIGDDDDEEDKTKAKERVINSMIDSIFGGLGFGGNVVVTLKNTLQEYLKQEEKGPWTADHTYTILKFFSLSPTIGSKGRKLYSAIQEKKFKGDVMKEMSLLDIDNPRWSIIANIISATTNIPLDRIVKKMDNVDAAITEEMSAIERLALLMGWNTWDLDIDDSDVLAIEEEIKKDKSKKKKEKEKKKEKKKKEEKEEEEEEKNIKEQKKEKKEGKKNIKCAAVTRGGGRCKNETVDGTYCTIHVKVEQGTKEVQCKKIKSNKERCKMKTKAKSGLCYYHD